MEETEVEKEGKICDKFVEVMDSIINDSSNLNDGDEAASEMIVPISLKTSHSTPIDKAEKITFQEA